MNAWHKLKPQAELTLNLMRGSRLNPAISAWAHVHGPFDFNATPIAPQALKCWRLTGLTNATRGHHTEKRRSTLALP
jgi:hypothetical protein